MSKKSEKPKTDTHVRTEKLLERAKASGNKAEIAKWQERLEACEAVAA